MNRVSKSKLSRPSVLLALGAMCFCVYSYKALDLTAHTRQFSIIHNSVIAAMGEHEQSSRSYDSSTQVPLVNQKLDYGSISDFNNPYRSKFLVPLYACDEQETGAQMHVRQLLHLSKALDRTLVLPNFGFGIPTISNCHNFSYDAIYDIEQSQFDGYWTVPFPTFMKYLKNKIDVRQMMKQIPSALTVMFGRHSNNAHMNNLPFMAQDVLNQTCVPSQYFEFSNETPTKYITVTQFEKIERVKKLLNSFKEKEVLFIYFNHPGFFVDNDDFFVEDAALQQRPEWGLWSGLPFPQWNYSSYIHSIAHEAWTRLPDKYLAAQWRMEQVPYPKLQPCADLYALEIINRARLRQVRTLYLASDAPIGETAKYKSASFNPEPGIKEAMAHLIQRVKDAGIRIVTWDDIAPVSDDPEDSKTQLSEKAGGIFDRLTLGNADWLIAANPHCGFKSSFIGSIQTLRQDRIGNIEETDWEKLGMSWVGPPIEEKFFWHVPTTQTLEELGFTPPQTNRRTEDK